MPQVDKIFGPGNLLVQLAKKAVYGVVGIDSLQGATETLVISDDRSDPALCAADLLAQAEHDPEARVVMVTTSERMATRERAGSWSVSCATYRRIPQHISQRRRADS